MKKDNQQENEEMSAAEQETKFDVRAHFDAKLDLPEESQIIEEETIIVDESAGHTEGSHASSNQPASSTEKYVIAFGAARIDFPVKGFSYLKEALKYLVNEMGYNPDDVHLLIFGAVRDAGTLSGIPVKFTHFGIIKDDHTLSQIYSAADRKSTRLNSSHLA